MSAVSAVRSPNSSLSEPPSRLPPTPPISVRYRPTSENAIDRIRYGTTVAIVGLVNAKADAWQALAIAYSTSSTPGWWKRRAIVNSTP
jgi:hypothetical protein